jgi:glycolate oxidase
MSHAVRKFAKHKLSEDVVVPRRQLTALIDHVRRSREDFQVAALCYGHAGDGNLHVNFLWDSDEERARVDLAVEALFRKTMDLGGTLSGEHGIGILKAPFLHLEQSHEQILLQERIKSAFDPHGIMNPGKIFPRRGHGSC